MIFLPKIFCPTFSVLATLWFRQMLTSTGWCLLKFANGSTLIKNLVNMRKSSTWMTIKFWTKLPSLLTHFSPFHFLFPTKFYFTNILLSTFFHFTNIKLNFFPFTNIKEKKGWRNVNEGLRNKLNKVLLFFFFENTKYFDTHTHRERREGLKEIDSGIDPKEFNSWIHSTCFKPL